MKDAFVRASDRLSLNSGYHHVGLSFELPRRRIKSFAETYELDEVDDGHLAFLVVLQFGALLLVDQRPQLVQIEGRAEVVVAVQMEVAHTQLTEVTGMVLVHVDAMVVHATSVTATTGMLTVLSYTNQHTTRQNEYTTSNWILEKKNNNHSDKS